MSTAKPSYGAAITLTFAFASLATTAGLLAGRASTAADNTTDLAVDSLVGGQFTTTATTTTNTQIQIWAYGLADGTNYSGGCSGTDGNVTLDAGAKNLLRLLTIIPNITTTAVTYTWGPFSIAQAFGGTMPGKWGLYVVHNTGQIIAATPVTKYVPVQYVSV